MEKQIINKNLDVHTFRNFYYLKEELITFCKQEDLQATGSKEELTNRIAHYLETGEKIRAKRSPKQRKNIDKIDLESKIEENFVCTEAHRAFYKENIGKSFSFNVLFQQWLKQNAGKTYQDSITAYYQILENKKNNKTKIDKQFEYNTYIRDFFHDNKDKSLKDAITCWKYKKSIPGHNKYEKGDLKFL
ncbi:DUF6434 domain-containing protein [Gracilibacillus sp. S3-1-1]|uniref:DUF6434 domain-containing protein n=1 Tax=Gracilibacillus pellucidus TaxID=3095368 RepID=A0ACC6M5H0_9BACI|nr:DUF6434 domain-containing protein [Gracilibacillus sp. S3-1-1]MDX8046221.1 DUF6434 domain-containing protein [Gracilibacillus sp. S3-1-1]